MAMTVATASEALRLYRALQDIDWHLDAMTMKTSFAETPLQKVTFYKGSSTYSGPVDYEPKHCARLIAAAIMEDMHSERRCLVNQIRALGFAADDRASVKQT